MMDYVFLDVFLHLGASRPKCKLTSLGLWSEFIKVHGQRAGGI